MKITNKKKMATTWQREAVAWLRGKAAEQAQNNERWPEHAKCFEVVVKMREQVLAQASGNSKKEAEQNAAKLALETLGVSP